MIMADSLEHMGVKPAEYKPQLPIFARLMNQETRNAVPAFDDVDSLLTDTMLMPVLFFDSTTESSEHSWLKNRKL
jgi:hypothetical protein